MEAYENIHLPGQYWKITNYLGSGTYGRVYGIERNIAGIQEKAV